MRVPSPIRAIQLRGRRLGLGRWPAYARGRGRLGMLGLSLTIRGHSTIRLHPLVVFHPLALAPAWVYRRPDGHRTDK